MYLANANSRAIVEAVSDVKARDGDVVLILLGEKETPDIPQMISHLNQRDIDFFGGVFPGLIYGDEKHDVGAVIKVLPALGKPVLVRGLDAEDIALPDFGKEMANRADKQYTAMILVDGLTANISLFLSEVFNRLGNSVHYFGGGAGSLSLRQEPCVFTPEGFFQDAAVVAFIKLESSLGVRHGWQRIMGPIVATRTQKNVISELNWRNAFEVYRETVEVDSGTELSAENFFDVAKGYPFGIYKEEAEDIVRDPIAVNEQGELICVGEVPENTVLNILKGAPSSLIQAAGQAADHRQSLEGKEVHHSLVVDCISRVLFLEGDFSRELAVVKQAISSLGDGGVPAGVLTLGEISSYGQGFLEFFNKTIVTGVLYE